MNDTQCPGEQSVHSSANESHPESPGCIENPQSFSVRARKCVPYRCVLCSEPITQNMLAAHGSPTAVQLATYQPVSHNVHLGSPPSVLCDISPCDYATGCPYQPLPYLVPINLTPAYAIPPTDVAQREWLAMQAILEKEAIMRRREQLRVAWMMNNELIAHH